MKEGKNCDGDAVDGTCRSIVRVGRSGILPSPKSVPRWLMVQQYSIKPLSLAPSLSSHSTPQAVRFKYCRQEGDRDYGVGTESKGMRGDEVVYYCRIKIHGYNKISIKPLQNSSLSPSHNPIQPTFSQPSAKLKY